MIDFAKRRQQMVVQQIEARGVRDKQVLEAMGKVRREAFVLENVRDLAYMKALKGLPDTYPFGL